MKDVDFGYDIDPKSFIKSSEKAVILKIDYYEELKAKADKYDELETPFKPTELRSNSFGDIIGKCKCGTGVLIDENYCTNCGTRLDWTDL